MPVWKKHILIWWFVVHNCLIWKFCRWSFYYFNWRSTTFFAAWLEYSWGIPIIMVNRLPLQHFDWIFLFFQQRILRRRWSCFRNFYTGSFCTFSNEEFTLRFFWCAVFNLFFLLLFYLIIFFDRGCLFFFCDNLLLYVDFRWVYSTGFLRCFNWFW